MSGAAQEQFRVNTGKEVHCSYCGHHFVTSVKSPACSKCGASGRKIVAGVQESLAWWLR